MLPAANQRVGGANPLHAKGEGSYGREIVGNSWGSLAQNLAPGVALEARRAVHTDPFAARLHLRELAALCREGAVSPDPRVTLLALSVVARAGQELEAAA